ncbi:hypothetical protein [Succinimonas amylolytica]|uniref:hypothetical protein n=1 Tax=Succinimonas amylolytica TaxID=83769 RepID=UPI0023A812AF
MKRSVFHSENFVLSSGAARSFAPPVSPEPVTALSFWRLYRESQLRLVRFLASWYASSCWGMYLAVFPASSGYLAAALEKSALDAALPVMVQRNFVFPPDSASGAAPISRTAVLIYGHETRRIRDERTFRDTQEALFRDLGIPEFAYLSFSSGKIFSGSAEVSGLGSSTSPAVPASSAETMPEHPGTPRDLRFSGIIIGDLLQAALHLSPLPENVRRKPGIPGFDMYGKAPEAPLALMLFQKIRDLRTWTLRPAAGSEIRKPGDYLPDPERDIFRDSQVHIRTADKCYRKFLEIPVLREQLPGKFVTMEDLDPGLWPEFFIWERIPAENLFSNCSAGDPDLRRKIARSRAAALKRVFTGTFPEEADPLEEIPSSWKFRARAFFRFSRSDHSRRAGLERIFGKVSSGISGEFSTGTDGLAFLEYNPDRDYSTRFRDDPGAPSDIADLITGYFPGYAALYWFFVCIMVYADRERLPEFAFAFNTPWRPESFLHICYEKLPENALPDAWSVPAAWLPAFRWLWKRGSFFSFIKVYEFTYRVKEAAIRGDLLG